MFAYQQDKWGRPTTTTYYYAGGKRVALAVNGTFSYLGTDGQGSASVALDGTGSVQASVLYGPYGAVRYSSGTMPGSYGYTGQQADATTGLDYYNARYYDASAGQFASADTAQDGLNRYGYVHGNPTTATDPICCRLPWSSPAARGRYQVASVECERSTLASPQ
ncbi:MAG: RHS repeat-associated core domain-containing protein [Ktedonobacterales bacterium]